MIMHMTINYMLVAMGGYILITYKNKYIYLKTPNVTATNIEMYYSNYYYIILS